MFRDILPPTYLAIAIILILVLHFVIPLAQIIEMPWRLAGLIPLVLGAVLNLAADNSMKRYETTVKPFKRSTTLVTEGVFKICRHPMYLGFVLILLGIAVLLGSAAPFLIVILFPFFLEFVYIREEERMLGEQFEQQWEDYCTRVRKWI